MALTFGGKRRPGGRGPRVPLNPLEARLTDRIAEMIRSLARIVDVDAYAEAIRALDPDLLERLLQQGALRGLDERIADVMRGAIMDGGTAEARRIIAATPIPFRTPATALEYPGVRLPSGIIIPTGLLPPEVPDVEFRVASPRDDLFTYVDKRATQYAQTRAAELVTSVDQSNRLAIRQIIADAFTGPATADETARRLRQVIGLHPRWARAVVNFEDANLRRLLAEGVAQDVARERVDGLTKRYRDRLIRRRAQMIARTELARAASVGRVLAWEAGVRTGYVDQRSMKQWSATTTNSRYGPPCDVCGPMNGKRVPWNGTFPNGLSHPPAHPHCRCSVVLIPPDRGTGLDGIDWDAAMDRDEAENEEADLAEYEERRAAYYASVGKAAPSLDRPVLKHGDHDQSTHGRRGKGSPSPRPESSGRTVLREDGSFRYGEIDFGVAPLPSVEQASQRFAYWSDNWATRVASANMMGLRPPRARNGYDKDIELADDEEMIFTAKYGEVGTYAEQQARPKIRAAIVLLDASARTVQTQELSRGLFLEEDDPRFSMTRGDHLTLPISAFSTDRRVGETYASGMTRMRPSEPWETPRRSLILRVLPGARGHATGNESEVVSQGDFRIVDVADEPLTGWIVGGSVPVARVITLRQEAHFDVRTGDWEMTDYA